MKNIIERAFGDVQDIAGEYIFSAAMQVIIVRFWKRMLIAFVIFAVGCVNMFTYVTAKIKDFSLEKVITDHPYSVLLIGIVALWFITIPLGKRR